MHKALHRLVLALTVTRKRPVGAERKLGCWCSGVTIASWDSIRPPEPPWGVPHLRTAVFLDPAGMRPVGDPNSLRSGEQREVEWVGSRPGCEKPRKHM